ncbi:hypothetical protein C1752_03379 [Acaryochloris thomasi RCC1774]|uniref:Uncharacterized protein n=1 Tax=Acaryochloris thomasi RCC1774 TaxID=1764569 RepID=A0A2W1JR31_9CYAN|nr:hypothetical protein [Acaryochloris thomasi]PZD72544.1 hypothetical protein C1752_03379 [Acaryochloris thomasi RCC1774]
MSKVGAGICQFQTKAKWSLQTLAGVSLILCLTGCDTQLQDLARRPVPKPKESGLTKATPVPTPVLTKLKVTVSSISDLKVKEGASVVKGQVIAEPTDAKQRISQRRQAIQQQLAQLNSLALEPRLSQVTAPQVSAEGVERAKVRLNAAEAALAQYRKDSPYTDFALQNLPLPEEQVKLERLQGEIQAAKAAVAREQAVLARIKASPSSNQGQGLSNLKSTQASLAKELQQLEAQAKNLKVFYSPYTGLINKITPLKSTNGSLQFELAIASQAQSPSSLQNPFAPTPPQNPLDPTSPQIPSGLSTPTLPLPTPPAISPQGSGSSLPPLPQRSPLLPSSQPPN